MTHPDTKPVIAVTGASGKTGAAVVRELRAMQFPVRAIVRKRDARSAQLEAIGAETVIADMYDPTRLADALKGARRAYYVTLFEPYMIHSAAAFAVAARDAKLEHVVQMSQWTSSPNHPSSLTRQTWLVDKLLSTLPGVGHTIVNPGMFADNFLRVLDMAALMGTFPVLSGTSRSAPVANEDIARVVAHVLADPETHASKRYRPTGPKLLSGQEMAAIMSQVLGNKVRPINMPFWMLSKVARLQGIHPFEIVSLRYYMRDHKAGVFEFEGGVNDTVRELTGRPAEDFEITTRRYAALPFAQKTLANRLRALVQFMIVPLYPGYNLDTWEARQGVPPQKDPELCLDSDIWLREHTSQVPVRTTGRAHSNGVLT